MATPTIIIGIGTSGLRILEYVQRFHYEAFNENKPPHVEYLYIETNIDNEVGITPMDNQIKRVYVSLKELKTMCKYVNALGANWVPPLSDLLNYGLGAGGVRPVGRVGFWGKNNDQKNYIIVKKSIADANKNVRNIANPDIKDVEPIVFVTGTLTGGTGSGIFIDLAYLIRNSIKNIRELYGLFLLPPIPEDLFENAQYYANAYGAIKDLDYFNRPDTHYKEILPDGEDVDFIEPPFDLVHLISQNHIKGDPAISTLEGLYKMAGLNLFLNISGVKEHRTERLVDSPVSKFGTFGLSGIQYPKDQIQEYMSATLSIDLVQRWNDHVHFISHGNKININRNEIAEKVNSEWDSIINESFNILDSLGGNKTIKNELYFHAFSINKGEVSDPYEFIVNQFTSRSAKNYYVAVNDNLPSARNIIVDRIYNYTSLTLNETENIHYTRIMIDFIGKAIDDTLNYWKSLGLSDIAGNWEILLAKYVEEALAKKYKNVWEHDPVLSERLYSIFELLKMHLLFRSLVDICDTMKNKTDSIISTSTKPRRLPKAIFLEELANEFKSIIETDKVMMSFKKRQADIILDVHDRTLPIIRVYQTGSFEKEVESALSDYRRNESYPTKKDIIGEEDLWAYLTSKEKQYFLKDIYSDCIKNYRKRISRYVKDYDVIKYIKDNLSESKRIAKKATNVFLSLKEGYTLDTAHYLPRFVASSSETDIIDVLTLFKDKENFSEFELSNPKTILELPRLRNIMVFYDEKSGLLPLEMISYADQMKNVYDKKPGTVNDITDEQWKIRTRAYIRDF